MEILADGAFLRPLADGPTVAQVTIVGPKELQIRARRGAWQFAYAGETVVNLTPACERRQTRQFLACCP